MFNNNDIEEYIEEKEGQNKKENYNSKDEEEKEDIDKENTYKEKRKRYIQQ